MYFLPFSRALYCTLQYCGLAFTVFAAFSGLVLNYLHMAKLEADGRQDALSSAKIQSRTDGFKILVDFFTTVTLVANLILIAHSVFRNSGKVCARLKSSSVVQRVEASRAVRHLSSIRRRVASVGANIGQRTGSRGSVSRTTTTTEAMEDVEESSCTESKVKGGEPPPKLSDECQQGKVDPRLKSCDETKSPHGRIRRGWTDNPLVVPGASIEMETISCEQEIREEEAMPAGKEPEAIPPSTASADDLLQSPSPWSLNHK